MSGRAPSAPRAQRDRETGANTSKAGQYAPAGSMSPVGAPTGPKSLLQRSQNGQSPPLHGRASSSTSTARLTMDGTTVPSAPRSMANSGSQSRTNGAFGTTSASRKPPSLAISLNSRASTSNGRDSASRSSTSIFDRERERDHVASSSAYRGSASSSSRTDEGSFSHYTPSQREAAALARAALGSSSSSQPSRPREPSSAPPPPPGASSYSQTVKLQAPKMAISIKASASASVRSKSASNALSGTSTSKSSATGVSSTASNPLRQFSSTSKGKQPERGNDAEPATSKRERQTSSRGHKMFLPDHLDRDEIMAEASFPLVDAASLPEKPAQVAMSEAEIQELQAKALQKARAVAAQLGESSRRRSPSPVTSSPARLSSVNARRKDQISEKEDGEVTPASATFPPAVQESQPSLMSRLGPPTASLLARISDRDLLPPDSAQQDERHQVLVPKQRHESTYDSYRPKDSHYTEESSLSRDHSRADSRAGASHHSAYNADRYAEAGPSDLSYRSCSRDNNIQSEGMSRQRSDTSSHGRYESRESSGMRVASHTQSTYAPTQHRSIEQSSTSEPMSRRISHPLPPKPPAQTPYRYDSSSSPHKDVLPPPSSRSATTSELPRSEPVAPNEPRSAPRQRRESGTPPPRSRSGQPEQRAAPQAPLPSEPPHEPPPPPPEPPEPPKETTPPPPPPPPLPSSTRLSSLTLEQPAPTAPPSISISLRTVPATKASLPATIIAESESPSIDSKPTMPVQGVSLEATPDVPVPVHAAEPPAFHRNKFALYDPELDKGANKKSKETVYRYMGEGIPRPVKDPRGDSAGYAHALAKSQKKRVTERIERIEYQYDSHSCGPPPPSPATAIAILGLTTLTVPKAIATVFCQYGRIAELDLKFNPATGGSLGICFLKYADEVDRIVWIKGNPTPVPGRPGGQDGHASARLAMQKMDNQKSPTLAGIEGKLRIFLDGDGSLAHKAAKAEIQRRKDAEEAKLKAAEEAKRKAKAEAIAAANAAVAPISVSASQAGSPDSKRLSESTAGIASNRPYNANGRSSTSATPYQTSNTQDQRSKPSYADAKNVYRHNGDHWSPGRSVERGSVASSSTIPTGPAHISPTRAAATGTREPYRLPGGASTKQSPGGQRLGTAKGKGRASDYDSETSSEEERDGSDSEEAQRQRDKDDQVFFHGSRKAPGALDIRKTSALHDTGDGAMVEEIDPDLKQTRRVMMTLAKQDFQYLLIKKEDLKEHQTGSQNPGPPFVRGLLGKSNPLDILEDAAAFYVVFAKNNAAYAQRGLEARNASIARLKTSIEDPPTLAQAEALPETRLVTRASQLPAKRDVLRFSESELLRIAKKILIEELRNAVGDDLRYNIVPDRVQDLWDHRTTRAEGKLQTHTSTERQSQSSPGLASNSRASQTPAPPASMGNGDEDSLRKAGSLVNALPPLEASSGKVLDRPPRFNANTSSTRVGALPSFAKRRDKAKEVPKVAASVEKAHVDGPPLSWGQVWDTHTSHAGLDDDGWRTRERNKSVTDVQKGVKQVAEAVSPITEKKAVDKEHAKALTHAKTKPKRHAAAIIFTSSEESNGDSDNEDDVPLSKQARKIEATKPPQLESSESIQGEEQAVRDSSPLTAISDDTIEETVPLAAVKEDILLKSVDVDIEPRHPSDIAPEVTEDRVPTVAEAIASLPTPAPTESSIASTGKRELSVDVPEANEGFKKARLASPTPPLSAIKPSAPEAAPRAKGKKGGKKGKKGAAAARARNVVEESVEAVSKPADVGCEDDEDLYYLRMSLQRRRAGVPLVPEPKPELHEDLARPKHDTGSARTEGYYKIPQIEKLSYLAARNQARAEAGASSSIAVSRLARVNARHLASGLDKHKKASASDTDILQFNQLRTRKKQMRFARSPIHDWGLYAMEQIPAGEMVIEYVGESIRQQVADKREKMYERNGIGSSYLFRVDDDVVIDATMKGNLGRLINHCCTPNCTARILSVGTSKKIVIFAKQPIYEGDEITYDYHFPIEDEKIVCLCGSSGCRGFLN